MHMLLLSLHVLVATLLVLSTLVVFAAGWQKRATKVYSAMLTAFAGTIGSGVIMLFVGFGGIGRICAAMSAVTLLTLVARHYYRAQLAITA